MAFLRVKKIKGKEYGYLVANKWTSKGPRQSVKKYLGRIYRLKGRGNQILRFKGGKKEFLTGLVEYELDKIRGGLAREKIEFDSKSLKLMKGKKNCVLALNEGFMCDFTLKRVLNFRGSGDIEVDSVKLAKFFIEAGFAVPKEAFIGYFERL